MAFLESPRFPDCIAFGASGGPAFFTDVVGTVSGFEQRNQVWQYARLSWDVGHVARPDSEMQQLIAFFRAVHGRADGFRFKDHSDYQVPDGGGVGIVGSNGAADGTPTQQLYKKYTQGASADLRKISKPVGSTVKFYVGGVLQSSGYVLDPTSGIISLTPIASAVVTAISKANPAVVTTSAAHPFSTGQTGYLRNVAGMTQVNNRAFVVTSIDPTHFSLNGENSTGYSTFTGTALAERYLQPSQALTWTGEFDVPCRFDTDTMKYSIVDKTSDGVLLEAWDNVPIVELRV